MNSQSSDRAVPEDMPLVTLCRYSYLHEALIAREMLETEGVQAFIPDEHVVSLSGGGYTNALGGIRLQVREDDVDRAREVLDLRADGLSRSSHEGS